ncbi:hypothetical protein CONLIGDRAFT_700894 [Coniochaeta ligniaria NRRL 30616]|uniref:F-box domain-containing protein n=1 Tax=Coniochaeta ligniaria NRRL 30616 TaxID=1408157 RepID=A0A1J7JCV8_9PEZI|nr:hypothetical protein CONLIGDRAFT_700894 [Coniochaeta ligniaria NRRL 30616]
MVQLYSRCLGRAAVPTLLNLPVEMLLFIADHLSSTPEGILALALTCRSLFHVFRSDMAKLRNHQCRSNLLLLLEKDLGDRFFYCSMCCQLHSFPPWWKFGRLSDIQSPLLSDTKHRQQRFWPGTAGYRMYVSFAHARLVMNRHLYGAPKGLPLGNLDVESTWAWSTVDCPMWQQRLSARIFGDELFLRVAHTIEGTDTTLRKALDEAMLYRVCTDVVGYDYGLRRVLALAGEPEDDGEMQQEEGKKKAGARSSLRTCRDELGSCTICLTDYTTAIERSEIRIGPVVDGWRVTITAYHGVGGCRDVEDWRWVALVGANTGYGIDFSAALDGRDTAAFPPGWVMQKWQAADHLPEDHP